MGVRQFTREPNTTGSERVEVLGQPVHDVRDLASWEWDATEGFQNSRVRRGHYPSRAPAFDSLVPVDAGIWEVLVGDRRDAVIGT
jgi:hypothetical protein